MNNRDNNGRFMIGNTGGPGNPYAPKVQAIRIALYDAVTSDDVKQAIRRLIALTQDNDPKVSLDAIKVLFDRLVGKPVESVSLDVATDSMTRPPIINLTSDELAVLERLAMSF